MKPRRPAPDMSLEAACVGLVCGVDEAGRGPWAGPVSAGAVILDPTRVPLGLDDSKRLTHAARARLEIAIMDQAVAWGVGFASAEEIDELNILRATGLAMRRAVEALHAPPMLALVDGNYPFALPCPVRTVVGGDGLSCSIAAASILAKVARDRLMIQMDALYPDYGFAAHKGYHAPVHVDALRRLGPCPIHRASWAPIRRVMSGEDVMYGDDRIGG